MIEYELTFEEILYLIENGYNIEIETPNGSFTKILKTFVKRMDGYDIIYNDGTDTCCAETHRMLTDKFEWITANELHAGNVLVGRDYKLSKTIVNKSKSLNDIWIDFSVENKNEEYIQNDIVHHNSGKSAMIYTIFRYLIERLGKTKTMLIVPNTSLVEQMFSDFIDYGWLDINKHVTKLYAGRKPDYNKPILITTWQSIYKQPESFFKDFDAVLIDECQSAKSMSISSVMKKCKKADYRLGFTGTLPTEKADDMNIKSSLGPVIFELKSKELIDKGVLSMIYIANILLRYPEEVISVQKGRSYPEEVRFIETYTNRNKAFDFVFNHIKDKQNTLILCNHLEHLSQMETYLKMNLDKKYIIYIISGEIKTQEREDIRRLMEKGENLILLASYGTMSAGVNIKRIHNVIFASSSKSKIRVLQSIGRGLRKHESKDCVVLWDLIDDLTYEKRTGTLAKNYMYQHWEERIKFYEDQGFKYHNKTITL